ncbi:immunoglobulin-like domain-containing protein [Rummeliibacillus sp. NPDC094406]|uniref:immunoglobulin-like domain-containing protein n=1 Tax=Rummeliibacillus sp. NPDC094406 TaxID=3364511 RepID=UPI00380B852C
MKNYKQKLIKSATAFALGVSVITTAVVAVDTTASAKTSCKVSHGKLVNPKSHKLIAGFKTYQSVLYKNGKKFTGVYKGKYYKCGTLFTGVVTKTYYKKGVKATATVKGVYYKQGKPFTGDKHQVFYKNGKPFTGEQHHKFYKNGKPFTGEHHHVFFENGKKVNCTMPNGKYYINGVPANGIYEINGVKVEYKNGKVVTDKTSPVISLEKGAKSVYKIKNGEVFTVPTATAKDHLGNSVEVVSSIIDSEGKAVEKIDTTVAGTYTITYTAKDNSSNKATAIQISVEVKKATPVLK